MGEVIRKSAAVEDIFADVRTAMRNGVTKGGRVKEIVEAQLGPVVVMIDTVEAERSEAQKTAAPLIAKLKAKNESSDDLLGRVYDELWNDLGRPAYDRALALIFPGGTGYYADGETESQPERMVLLAELLERGMHPTLTKEQAGGAAQKIRANAAELRAVVEEARLPIACVTLFERIRTATARAEQFELSSLKRSLKNAGLSETEIHAIIPDRSAPAPKKSA